MFVFLNQFPLALPMSILTLVVLWIFFVAGADAGTVVLGSMSTGGPIEPKRWIKLSWGVAMAAIAGILLVAGGLGALQSASVLFGVPFAFIMVAMCVSFYIHLRSEARSEDRQGGEDIPPAPARGRRLRRAARAGPGVRGRGACAGLQQATRDRETGNGGTMISRLARWSLPLLLAIFVASGCGASGGGSGEEG